MKMRLAFYALAHGEAGETRYIKAKIRQTNTKEKISSLNEDPYVEILRRKQENDDVSPSLKVSEAWNAGYSGKGVIIAVVDDGLQTDHPDISQTSYVFYKNELLDSDEATAFKHYISNVDIYSNSWGPQDGSGFEGPGYLAKKALHDGVTTVRSIENGFIYDVIQNLDMVMNCIFQTTTTIKSRCTNAGIQGTSFSAPIATAIIAMTLEANPNLTWRDIQHLVVLTSNKNNFIDTFSDWSLNGANQEYRSCRKTHNKSNWGVEITNLTVINELCSIYTTLSPCSSKLKCKVLNGKPSCVSK
ncbi:unnamed protein product [Mytilus edulis]|uniref:Peptidase S8/S53 domain-containing protein n=1 Tax=Mytilus edulis TaxID=6550 RepID=A0A8S3SXJ3_MYTED|nr:unnamed protein product [Mytilus edulis]